MWTVCVHTEGPVGQCWPGAKAGRSVGPGRGLPLPCAARGCAGFPFTNQNRPSPYLARLPHRLCPSLHPHSRQAWPSSRALCLHLAKPLPQLGSMMLASCSAPLLESRHCTSTAWPAGSPHPHRLGVQKACSKQLWGRSKGKSGFPRLPSQRACVSVSACG